jgi:predicted transcriptional regulator
MAGELLTTPIQASKPDKPRQNRMTDRDKAFALRYHTDGLTQVEIAQRLGVSQPTISAWLSQCNDTTVEASLYFRGQALPMAEKIVKQGRPSDLIKVLQGVSVLAPEQSAGLVIQIGCKDSDVSITLSPPSIQGVERKVAESLTIQAGSDKVDSVNPATVCK